MNRIALRGFANRLKRQGSKTQQITQKPFHSCSINFASKQNTKFKNSPTASSLFPVECEPAQVNVVEIPTYATPSVVTRTPAVSSSNDDGSSVDVEDDGETFGTLASPETLESLRKLDQLWPLTGWNDDVEDEDHGVGQDDRALRSSNVMDLSTPVRSCRLNSLSVLRYLICHKTSSKMSQSFQCKC